MDITVGDNVPSITFQPPSRSQTLEEAGLDQVDPTALSVANIPSDSRDDDDETFDTTESEYCSIHDDESDASIFENHSETHPPDQGMIIMPPRGRNPRIGMGNGGRIPRLSPSPASRRAYSPIHAAPSARTRTQSDVHTVSSQSRFVRPCHSNGTLRSTSKGPAPNTVHLPEDILSPGGRKALDKGNSNSDYKGSRNRSPSSVAPPTKRSVSKKGRWDIERPMWTKEANSRNASTERKAVPFQKPSPRRPKALELPTKEKMTRKGDWADPFPQVFTPVPTKGKAKAQNAHGIVKEKTIPKDAHGTAEERTPPKETPVEPTPNPVQSPSTLSPPASPHNNGTPTNAEFNSTRDDEASKPESKYQGRSPMTLRFSLESLLKVSLDLESPDEDSASPGSSDSDHYSSGEANSRTYTFMAKFGPRRRKRYGRGMAAGSPMSASPLTPATPVTPEEDGHKRTTSTSTAGDGNGYDYTLRDIERMRRSDQVERQ